MMIRNSCEVLLLTPLPATTQSELERRFKVTMLWEQGNSELFLSAEGARFEVACTRSTYRIDAALLQKLDHLKLLACFGAGVDGIDLHATRSRGIAVTNTPDVLTDDVADIAIALMLIAARRLLEGDRFVRAGRWTTAAMELGHSLRSKRVGIVGLGRIGTAVAHRAAAFGMSIQYFSRTLKPSVPFEYADTVTSLAAKSDFLVVCAAGGLATKHLIDAAVIAALGPTGTLINVSRGSVVDEQALIEALKLRQIRAAALDVFENEPNIRSEFRELENVILLPHMGSATVETRGAMGRLLIDNIGAYFSGKNLPTPIP